MFRSNSGEDIYCRIMGYYSDDEYYEEETLSRRSNTSLKGDEAFAKKKSGLKKSELDEQLKEYISDWRKNREQEEEELKKMKEKQLRRKEIRAEQDRILAQQKKDEEDQKRKEESDRKAAEADEKKRLLEQAEAKRMAVLEAQKANPKQKSNSSAHEGNSIRRELSKTKEQLEEEKKIALSIRIKPIDFEILDSDELKSKASELFDIIVKLETDKYDYEQRKVTQELDLKELKERQKSQLRQKALKKGLDPDALTGKYPPMIRMYSKYERRTDTRSYEDRKKLYEGGWEVIRAETLDSAWKEKFDEWSKRPTRRLPKWFGERPGKKKGEPETPEGEDDAPAEAAAAAEEYEEEEEDEEEYDEEE